MTEIVLPEDTNTRGSLFGGRVLALIDKCAGISAMRHSRRAVLTASMDSVQFKHQVSLGNVLLVKARINAAFNSSMEVEVEVHSEDPYTGDRKLTTKALVTMVAVDRDGHPARVPALEAVTEGEKRRAEEALRRRQRRLADG
jgi:acyl-CoA hydrolase